MYADDALLFLGDANESLVSAVNPIETFGSFSGYSINWDKSVLIPLDEMSPILPQKVNQIRIAKSFKYLGIGVSFKIEEYLNQNIE